MAGFSQWFPPGSLPWLLGAAVLLALGALLIFAGLVALFGLHPLRFVTRTLFGMLLISLGVLEGGITLGLQGYRALTREQVAARVLVKPSGPQRFSAVFEFPDGKRAGYSLAGDEIYVDAHILKWKSVANLLGLHTAYELDRVGGRYHALEQERTAQRTLYSLGKEQVVDLYGLRQRYPFLSPLIDAEHGSASFVPVNGPTELEVRVTTSGLLLRPAGSTPN
jgi:hypothetical protein